MSFYELRLKAGFNCRKEAAKFCGVTTKTIKAWESKGAPETVLKLMGILSRDLSPMGKAWRGVFLEHDCLSTSRIDFVYPCEIGALKHLYHAAGIERYRAIDNSRYPYTMKSSFYQTLSR